MRKIFNFKFLQLFKIDTHILHTLMLRGWSTLAGAATIIMIPVCLTASEQGYYYAFASLLALQVFFELGFNQVIMQLVSHEAAYLQFNKDGKIVGEFEHVNRLEGLVGMLRRWYAYAAFSFFVTVTFAGWIFFDNHNHELSMNQWMYAWCVVVGLTSVNLYLSPRLAIIEGTGAIGDVARLRLMQSMAGYGLLWIILLNGFGLWAMIAVPFASAVGTYIWLNFNAAWIRFAKVNNAFSWRYDVLPLQWRIALSWVSGYIVFQLFTPMVFSIHGAVDAGRLGLAISIFSAITGLGMSWIFAMAPKFTMLIAKEEHIQLNLLFKISAIQSSTVTGILSLVFISVIYFLNVMKVDLVNRIVGVDILFWLALNATINTIIFACATYMRAHREEPLLIPSVVGAFLTLLAIYLTKHDMHLMMMTTALLQLFIGLPWCVYLLKKYIKRHV